jgi:predicted transcriptional regulator
VVCSPKKGRVGRKAIPVNLKALHNILLRDRMTIEDVCDKLNMSKWKIQKYLKKGLLRHHSSRSKRISLKLTRRLGCSGVLI